MLTDKAKQQIEAVLRTAIAHKELAGASCLIILDGKEIFYHHQGHADVAQGIPIQRDSLFRLYSMTKPVTAAAVMILFERGLLDLFDSVSRYLPGFKNQKAAVNGNLVPITREMTIKDLLNMTSGLVYPSDGPAGQGTAALFEEMDKRLLSDQPMSTLEAMNGLGQIPLAFMPGEQWAYGTSADVLGAIVEVVSQKSFGIFLQDELFGPLGMVDTGFYVPKEKRHRLAITYGNNESGELEVYSGNNLAIINAMDRVPAFESGGAGLVSTIDDYAKFAMMLMNGGSYNDKRILNPGTVRFLTTQVLDDGQMTNFRNWYTLLGHSYGNLMRVVTQPELTGIAASQGEYGWDGWLGCYFANLPKEKLTLLLMMQKKDAGTTGLTRKLRNIIVSEITGTETLLT